MKSLPVLGQLRRVPLGPRVLAPAALILLFLALPTLAAAKTRVYWIAAVPRTWNVIPNERDAMMNQSFMPAETILPTVVYRRYTANWQKPAPSAQETGGDEAGIQGPLLRRIESSSSSSLRR